MNQLGCWPLLILVVYLISPVMLQGPQVQSAEYVVKKYADFDAELEMAVVTATFDRDMFIATSCNNKSTITQVEACVTQSSGCIDTRLVNGTVVGSGVVYHQFKVTNPSTCDNVLVSLTSYDTNVNAYISVLAPQPDASSADISLIRLGSDVSKDLCCSDIMAYNPSWDGSIYITVWQQGTLNATYGIRVITDTDLDASEFFWLPTLELKCNDTVLVTAAQCGSEGTSFCYKLPPTTDPFFTQFGSLILIEGVNSTVVPRTQAQGIMTQMRLASSAQTSYFAQTLVSRDVLAGSACAVRYPNLQDSSGEINLNWSPLTRQILTCSAEKFALVNDALSSILDQLSADNTTTITGAAFLNLQASVHVNRNEWIACQQTVEALAPLTNEYDYVTIENTRECYADITSDEFVNDPCCNGVLQVNQCCAPRNVQVRVPLRAADSNAVNNTCFSPRCSEEVVNDYVTLQRSQVNANEACQVDARAALTDPIFTNDPRTTCYDKVFKYSCIDSSECVDHYGRYDTLCLGIGYCTLPCVNDTDCITGKCITEQGSNTCLLYDDGNQSELQSAVETLVECFLNNTNDFIRAFVLQDLGLPVTTPNTELRSAFEERLTRDTCRSRFYNPNPNKIDNQQQCESINECNWAQCNDAANPLCTAANCADPVIDDAFCQVCFGPSSCSPVSFSRCEYYHHLNTEQDCLTYPSSHWNPIAKSLFTKATACIKLVNTSAQCHNPAYCSAAEIAADICDSKCHFPTYTDGTTCSAASTAIGVTLTYIGPPGMCIAAAVTNKAECLTYAGAQWWPGTAFVAPTALSDQTVCELVGYCYDGALSFLTEAACIGQNYCDGYSPFNADENLCNLLGECSDYDGCHVPSLGFGCLYSNQIWTPNGCYVPGISATACKVVGGTMLTQSSTRQDCEAKALVCQEAAQFRTNPIQIQSPPGVSLKNSTECEQCGGTMRPYYKWTQLTQWIPRQFTPFTFQKKNFTQGYFWGNTIDVNYFSNLWNNGRDRRYISLVASRLQCSFGAPRSMLAQLACDCGANQSGGCFSGVTEQTVRSTQVCDAVPNKIDFTQGSFEAFKDVEVVDTDCTDMPITILPLSQFIQKRQISLSSSAVTLSQSGREGQAQIVKNSNDVAIGEVISSGISFDSNRTILRAQTCYHFPETINSSLSVKVLDLAKLTLTDNLAIFEPLGLNLPLDTKIYCIPFPGSSAVFPVALVDEWQETTFIEGLYFEEVFVIYFGAALYVGVLSLWIAQLILFLQKNVTRGYFQLPTAAFWILGVALLDRLLFLFLLPVGVLEKSRVATAIFAELPALLYYTIFSLIVLSWAKIYHFTASLDSAARYVRMKILLITMNAFMGVAFIVILIVFFSLDARLVITCEQDPSSLISPQEIAAIVYKVVFSLFCVALSVLFLIYGIRLIQLSNSLQTMSLNEVDQNDIKKTKAMLVKKTIVTVIGTACLLGQAANLIRASLMESNVFMLFFIYAVELVPVISFVIILKKAYYRKRKPKQQGAKENPKRHIGSHYKAMPAASHYAAISSSSDKTELLGDVAMTPVPKQNHLTNIAWSEISVQRDLGEGNFGTVSLGVWKGVQVALKRCKDPNNNEFLQEAQLMISIPHHPNVVKAFGTSQDGSQIVLVMEFCNGLSLDAKLFDMPDILTNKEKLQLLIGIAHGVNHLHKSKVIHRDLAARNVLLDGTGPKISDFGLSKKVEDVNEPNTTVDTTGPIRWMSPEALRGVYSSKTDIWTFGIVMYEVMTQCEPHIEEDTLFVGLKIRDQGYSPHIPETCDRAIAELMTQCWHREPSMRPDMDTICQALEAKWKSDFGNESVHTS